MVGGIFGGFIGSPMSAVLGATIGAKMNFGETGIAGRKYNGANNINVTQEARWLPWKTHGSYMSNNVWAKVNGAISQ